jgi:hypothetical protein
MGLFKNKTVNDKGDDFDKRENSHAIQMNKL